MKAFWVVFSVAIVITSFGQRKQQPPPDRSALYEQRLRSEIERLSVISGGKLGVTAIHLESGKTFSQAGSEAFPMASSYKIPIAVQLLTRVDSGKLSLDQLITFSHRDMHIGSGMIAERFDWPGSAVPGVALSVRSLIELMLLISDNSATDKCLELAGGPARVNACMARLGVQGVRVDRPTSWLIADWLGVPWPEQSARPRQTFDSLEKKVTTESMEASSRKFDSDPRDTATPDGMADLLRKIHGAPLLSSPSQRLLNDILKRCETGLGRLKGALPPGTEVRHKTGTIGMTTNDVGIITLPGDAGHLVVAAFVKSSSKPVEERENAIAQVTRMLHDYFLIIR